VNNFLAFCTGDYNPYMRYKGTSILNIAENRFICGGDIVNGDGTGSCTVYDDENKGKFMVAEKNKIAKFEEPYLLAMSANRHG